MWRAAHAGLFGEEQLVLLAGKDTAIVLEHHRKSWRWAKEHGWQLRRRTGAEEIVAPDGSRFIIRGKDSVYGYDVTYAIVDEAHGVDPSVVDDGLEPTLLERLSPQLHLVSTSHRRATPLMRRRVNAVVQSGFDDRSVLTLVWAALPGSDVGDPAVWRAANPYWSADREEFIRSRYELALAGQAEPTADDPDPLAAFTSQYLNMGWWVPLSASDPGEVAVPEADWVAADGFRLSTPVVGAVEGWFAEGAGLVLAERLPDGRVGVSARVFGSVDAAVDAAWAAGVGRVRVGKSVASGLDGVEPVGSTTRQCVLSLRRFLDDGVLVHDSSPDLTAQVLGLRVSAGVDGPRLVSQGRVDLVKAAVWAVEGAREFVEAPGIF